MNLLKEWGFKKWVRFQLWRVYQYPVAVRYALWIVLGLVLGAIGGFVSTWIWG